MADFDSNTALAFVNGQRDIIEPIVNATVFPEVLYADLIPVDTSAPEWTRSITVRNSEMYGSAGWINGNADDINVAGNKYGESQSTVHMAGIGYAFGYEELAASMANGVNLPNDDAIAARRVSEHFIDKVAFIGDEAKGMQGLLNTAGVTTISASGKFADATEDAILKDINRMLTGTATDTGYQVPADTLLLPYETMYYLASTPLSSKSGGTLLSFIQQYNVYTTTTGRPLTVRALSRLNGAATGGANDRAVAYANDPSVLKMQLPMPHKFLPTFQTGAMNFVVGGILRVGGLDIRNKGAVRYIDGV